MADDTVQKGQTIEELARLREEWGHIVNKSTEYIQELDKVRTHLGTINTQTPRRTTLYDVTKNWPTADDIPRLFLNATQIHTRITELSADMERWGVPIKPHVSIHKRQESQ